MIEHLPLALTALSSALNLTKDLTQLRDGAKLQEAVIQFNESIISAQAEILQAQSQMSAMSAKINELEQECVQLKQFNAEKSEYERREICVGSFAYVTKSHVGPFDSAHKYCCNCFDKGQRSTLSIQMTGHYPNNKLVCPSGCPDIEFQNFKENTQQ